MQPQTVLKPIVIRVSDLPLCCPPPHDSVWNLHPRVYLSITAQPNQRAVCPYCGAVYQLQ